MDDPACMQGLSRLAHIERYLHGLIGRKRAARGNCLLQRVARNGIVNRDKTIGHFVRCRNLRQARARARGDGRPHAAIGSSRGHLLANERTRAINGYALRHTADSTSKHALHPIGIIDAHGMHDLLFVQSGDPLS